MAIIKRLFILFSVLSIIAIIFACYFQYRYDYLLSYREIELEEIFNNNETIISSDIPHWVCITTQDQLNSINEKYLLKLPSIDFKEDMLIISYGAKLQRLDYNLKESTYKTRGNYIGFPYYSNLKQNTIYVYKTQFIPLFDTDVAGVAPDYKGKYR